jgi:hypothetical protein
MRDKAYRKKQEAKKSYKKFVSEMKHEKFKNPTKGSRNKKVNLNKLDYDNLSEEELSNLDDMVDED